MKKSLFTLLLLFIFGLVGQADNVIKEYDRMIVQFLDGRSIEIPINAASSIHSYVQKMGGESTKMVDIKGDGCFYQFKRSEILSLKFIESDVTGLPTVFDWEGEKEHLLQFEDNCVKVHKNLEGETLRVYDVGGRLVKTQMVPTGGKIDLSKLSQGVYSVSVNKYSIQIVKS